MQLHTISFVFNAKIFDSHSNRDTYQNWNPVHLFIKNYHFSQKHLINEKCFNTLTDTFLTKFNFQSEVNKTMPSCVQNWFTFTLMSTKRDKTRKTRNE